MPIRRWLGWAAVCPDCGKAVDLGDGTVAWQDRAMVVDAVMDMTGHVTQDNAIQAICRRNGCPQKDSTDAT